MKKFISLLMTAAVLTALGLPAFAEEGEETSVDPGGCAVQEFCSVAGDIASEILPMVVPDSPVSDPAPGPGEILSAGAEIASAGAEIAEGICNATEEITREITPNLPAPEKEIPSCPDTSEKSQTDPVIETIPESPCTPKEDKKTPETLSEGKDGNLKPSILEQVATPEPENTRNPEKNNTCSPVLHPLQEIRNWIFPMQEHTFFLKNLLEYPAKLRKEVPVTPVTEKDNSTESAKSVVEKKTGTGSSVITQADYKVKRTIRNLTEYFSTGYFQGIVKDRNMTDREFLPAVDEGSSQLIITAVFHNENAELRKLVLSPELLSLLQSHSVKSVKFAVGDVEYALPVSALKTQGGTVIISMDPVTGGTEMKTGNS